VMSPYLIANRNKQSVLWNRLFQAAVIERFSDRLEEGEGRERLCILLQSIPWDIKPNVGNVAQ